MTKRIELASELWRLTEECDGLIIDPLEKRQIDGQLERLACKIDQAALAWEVVQIRKENHGTQNRKQ